MPTVNQFIQESIQLESQGNQYKTLEGYMTNVKSLEWFKNSWLVEVYNFLKETMYYNLSLQCWMDK